MKSLEQGVSLRIRIVGVIFILGFALIGWRAFDLQVLQVSDWEERAERQHQKVVPLTAQRGTIFDSHGEELAVSVEVDSIYAEPNKLEDPKAAAKVLAKALDLPVKTVLSKLKGSRNFVWLKRQVTPRISEDVKALKLAGVNSIKEHRRFYPNSTIGAHLVGFTGLDPKGLEGLELKYDQTILGRGGYLVMERDALGRGIGAGEPEVQGARRGHDLYLTIDKHLQYLVERELAAGVRKFDAKAGSVIMLEPDTGRVLAMANQPDYNPNAFYRHKPREWRNRAVCDTYEPGSTFKVFLMAAALNEAVVGLKQKIDCENGSFRVGGKKIHDHKPYQKLTPAEIIKYSSNIGSAKIGKLLERQTFYDYIQGFGFGAQTGIDLPGEAEGLVRDPSRWFEVDLAAISFGQGISVTPMQLASATAAIANGGYLMKPYVVEKQVDSQGQVIKVNRPKVVRKVVARDVAQLVTRMMALTTEEGGTATKAQVPGFRVAGKTGTAQKVDMVTGGYSADKRVASFVGFLPADDPKVVLLVTVDEPKKQVYGGLVAAPIFSKIAAQTMQYMKVSPTQATTPAEAGPSVKEVWAELPTSEKSEVVAKTVPAGTNGPQMPDFVGLSYRQVLEIMQDRGLNVDFQGQGQVVEQSLPAGVTIPYGAPVWVRLAPPG